MTAIVASFYAYKGGLGRTMALANVAVVLARWGFRTLCIDWDLDAPALHSYFDTWMRPSNRPGIVELITAFEKKERPQWKLYVEKVMIPDVNCEISLIRAGILNETYPLRMQQRNLSSLYESSGFDQFLEMLIDEWKASYDFVLVDVRSGVTDSGGVGTVILPDILVALYGSNRQTIEGASSIAGRAVQMRYDLPVDRGALLVVPLFARADLTQTDKFLEWVSTASQKMGTFYGDWASRSSRVDDLIQATVIPYESSFTFGEHVPAVDGSFVSSTHYGRSIGLISALLAQRCAGSDILLSDPTVYLSNAQRLGTKLAADSPFTYDVFLSYPGSQRVFAKAISSAMQQEGLSVFFDENEIDSGQNFAERIDLGVNNHRLKAVASGYGLKPD